MIISFHRLLIKSESGHLDNFNVSNILHKSIQGMFFSTFSFFFFLMCECIVVCGVCTCLCGYVHEVQRTLGDLLNCCPLYFFMINVSVVFMDIIYVQVCVWVHSSIPTQKCETKKV